MADAVTPTSQLLAKQIGNAPRVLGGQSSNIQNQSAVAGQNAIQQAVAGGQQASAAQVQTAAAQQTAEQGRVQNAATQKALQQTQAQAQQGAQSIQSQRRLDLAKSSLQLDAESSVLADKLNQLQTGLKDELFEKQLDFQKDELGRTLWNDRQLMDYALETAKTEEELAEWQDTMTYYSDVRMQALKAAEQKITAAMEQAFRAGEFEKDANLKIVLAKKLQDLKKKMADEQNAQSNRAAMFSAGGTVIGAAVGAFGGPAGATVGASVGSALGNVAASQTK